MAQTTLRHLLAPLPPVQDGRQLELARDTLINCHSSIRSIRRACALDATRDFLDMLLMSIEAEVDGIASAASLIGEGA